jgi:SEC-C motif-containing protein
MTPCFCGSGKTFSDCCSPIITGQQKAASAEALMRARYSAYVSHDVAFVMNSTLPASRRDSDIEAMRAWAEQAEWQGLEIRGTRQGGSDDSSGEVEFVAHYKLQGVAQQHHERSEFVKEDGEWFFKDGEVISSGPTEKAKPVVNDNKVGRNDPCSCGSGKKFKKCCGA